MVAKASAPSKEEQEKAANGGQQVAGEATEGSLFDLNVSDVPPSIILANGVYLMRVDKIEFKKSEPKPGKTSYWYFNVRLGSVDYPTADDVYFMVPVPTPNDDERDATKKKRRLKEFTDAVGIDTTSPWDPQSSVGSEIKAELKQEPTQDGGLRNAVVKLV